MGQEYPRARRITHRSEFEKLLSKGMRVRTLDLDVRKLASPLGYVRAGLIVPKRGKTSVARNKLKRQLRELVRMKLLSRNASYDVVIRPRESAYGLTFAELARQVDDLGRQLNETTDTGPDA
jgi:ribonuclease P protein component